MAVFSGHWLIDILSVLVALGLVLVSWLKWSHGYWQRRGVITPPTSLPFGNTQALVSLQMSMSDYMKQLYNYLKSKNIPHGGFYVLFIANYVPIDLEITKNILQNNFSNFVDRGFYHNEDDDPLSAHIFALEGAKWRNLRTKLTPTFTSGKMKMMFETLVKCGDQLKEEMDKMADKKTIDINNILKRFTTDIIGNCAFGIDCNSVKNPDNEFKILYRTFIIDSLRENISNVTSFMFPKLAKKLRLRVTKPEIEKFFMKVVKDTVTYREEQNIFRKDFMHLLLQLKNRGKLVDDGNVKGDKHEGPAEVTLSLNELAAQAFLFFLAGYETSSTTLSFCLFELASNPDIQEKVRNEVNDIMNEYEGQLTYDGLMKMHYLEQVINESLRKYPPVPAVMRICTKTYTEPKTGLVIEEGTRVWIPVMGIHHDPEIYPEPEKFDPDRFSDENKQNRHTCAFLPFGEGPRVCIGLRFGMMQTKVGVCVLLRNYRFSLNSKTQAPLKLDPRTFIQTAEGGVWLDYTKI